MAIIERFTKGDRDAKATRLSRVNAYFQEVADRDGVKYLYLYNYAEGGPRPGDSPTQSIHFSREAAKEFKQILEQTFGPL